VASPVDRHFPLIPTVLAAAFLSTALVQHLGAAGARARQPIDRPTLAVDADTRLLVVAPHPDDEMLGAGGLMQQVHEVGGQVRVVYLTDGDGYPEGVRYEDHVESPTARDYRGYGRERKQEARAALADLGLPRGTATFLSFPDGGLAQLMRRYWSEKHAAFRSPYTRLDRPPKSDAIIEDATYRGEDLTLELAKAIGDYRPTLVLVPRKEDQHVDHCAAWFFLMDALEAVERVQPDYSPSVVNYIIHWYSWPFEDESRVLAPPPGLRGGASGWMSVPLTRQEQRTKRTALRRYQTQVHVMRWFLDGFARANEVFSRPAPTKVVLPMRRNICNG
jgi:LmbE family N-acetylglucosaminyl deacetylase